VNRTNRDGSGVQRRDFLAGLGALAASASLAQAPASVDAGPSIKVGLIGCGRRGVMIGKMFKDAGGYGASTA